jgi:hypothetical protein
MSEWQPMETAPRPEHGRRKVVDLWCVGDRESIEFYCPEFCGVKDEKLWQGRVNNCYWLDGAWRPQAGLRLHGLTVTPIAWMPLPSAPPAQTS